MNDAAAKAAQEYMDLLAKQEELHEDLAAYLVEEGGMMMLKHPLVYDIPYFPGKNAVLNAQYKHKAAFRDKAEGEGNWGAYVGIHERAYRFNAFYEIEPNLSDVDYWRLLGELYTDCENVWQIDFMAELFLSDRPGSEHLMNEAERQFLSHLPETVTIYRGFHPEHNNLRGMSWTLSPWHARWFAQRYYRTGGKVARTVINKNRAICLFMGRSEAELVIHTDDLPSHTILRDDLPMYVQNAMALAKAEFRLGGTSLHGPLHWLNVLRNATEIAKRTEGADLTVCQLFAVLHDCKREDEDSDNQHGPRAADFVRGAEWLRDRLNDAQINQLEHACRFHTEGKTTDDPTIGACWDADRLDLIRVSILPVAPYLSTEAAKTMICQV